MPAPNSGWPLLSFRTRKGHQAEEGPRRFAAQGSERALHALADGWQRGLTRRAEGLHDIASLAPATAEQLYTAGGA